MRVCYRLLAILSLASHHISDFDARHLGVPHSLRFQTNPLAQDAGEMSAAAAPDVLNTFFIANFVAAGHAE